MKEISLVDIVSIIIGFFSWIKTNYWINWATKLHENKAT